MGTMNMGFHYDIGKRIGYDITAPGLIFHHVAYHSKAQLIAQLKENGYSDDEISEKRVDKQKDL